MRCRLQRLRAITPTTSRCIESLDVNGVHFAGNTAANGEQALHPHAAVMAVNGTAEFNINHTAPPDIMG